MELTLFPSVHIHVSQQPAWTGEPLATLGAIVYLGWPPPLPLWTGWALTFARGRCLAVDVAHAHDIGVVLALGIGI
jgi:hypothetical protein